MTLVLLACIDTKSAGAATESHADPHSDTATETGDTGTGFVCGESVPEGVTDVLVTLGYVDPLFPLGFTASLVLNAGAVPPELTDTWFAPDLSTFDWGTLSLIVGVNETDSGAFPFGLSRLTIVDDATLDSTWCEYRPDAGGADSFYTAIALYSIPKSTATTLNSTLTVTYDDSE